MVPTNWDRELIPRLSEQKPDIQIYGVLPTSLIGSGGSGPDIPRMSPEQAEDYIKSARSAGIQNGIHNQNCKSYH